VSEKLNNVLSYASNVKIDHFEDDKNTDVSFIEKAQESDLITNTVITPMDSSKCVQTIVKPGRNEHNEIIIVQMVKRNVKHSDNIIKSLLSDRFTAQKVDEEDPEDEGVRRVVKDLVKNKTNLHKFFIEYKMGEINPGTEEAVLTQNDDVLDKNYQHVAVVNIFGRNNLYYEFASQCLVEDPWYLEPARNRQSDENNIN
jgi:hypothetical protein